MNLILLGAPGAGKGTQAELISEKIGIPAISTGNMLREAMRNGSELGKQIKQSMDEGSLISDDVIMAIIAERIAKPDCENGYLLDGFPRNVFQAEELDKITNVERVVDIEVDFTKLLKRITGRRVCACGESYHVDFLNGKTECSHCGGKLYQRADDNEATVKERLSVYQKQTAPLIEYYSKAGKLLEINGDKAIDDVFEEIVEKLK